MGTIILYTVKLGLDKLNATQLVERARLHTTSMTGNANFVTPIPALNDIDTKADETEAAQIMVDKNGGKLDRQTRDERQRELYQMVKDLGGYVQAVCGGDGEKIASSGFATRALPNPPQPMPAPTNVRALATDMPGQVKLLFGGVKDRKSYVIYWTDGDPLVQSNFTLLDIISTTRFVKDGLDRDKKYSFRVAAVGRVGQGPMSDVAVVQPS